MNSKPRLIDLDFLKKISKSNVEIEQPNISSKVTNYVTQSFTNFIINYSDMIIVLMILGIILYFRYKYNIESKKKNKKPDLLEVNYHRTNDYLNGEVIDTRYKIDTNKETNNEIMDIVKNKINDFDNELLPADLNNMSSYSSL